MSGLEGRTLDRYGLKQLIGKGGMADVYLGYDTRFERAVAIKVFRRDDEELLRRFIREARLMANLRHAHLMPIYDAGESILDGLTQYYIVMPYMENGTLRGRIRRHPPLSLQDICRYLTHIADALDYIHQRGIIHRDIKSSNVLLDAEGRCYLSDFGIARTSTDATMTTTGGVLGTVDYVAPELFEEGQKASAYSDLYSLGVLAFEMVTRRFPFAAESQIALVAMHIHNPPPSPRSLAPQISVQAEKVILKALAKRPEQRYATATTFAEAFSLSLTPQCTTSEVTHREPANLYSDDVKTVVQPVSASAEKRAPIRPAPPARSTEGYLVHATGDLISQSPAHQLSPTRNQRRRLSVAHKRSIIVAGLVLVVLLSVGVPALFLSLNHQSHTIASTATPETAQPVAQVHTTAISTAKATLVPTPHVTATALAATATVVQRTTNATAIVTAQQTATVQAKISATAGIVQTATAGYAIYTDPLNNSRSPANWEANNTCTFQGDGYHALATNALSTCTESSYSYGDATISVDMTILSGQAAGVAFRMASVPFVGNYAGYLFEVDNQGNYRFSRSSVTTGSTLVKEGSIPRGFRTGYYAKNTLQIIMNGNSLAFYVNDVFLDQETDTAFTGGAMGFLALASNGSGQADVAYSHLRIFPIA